MPKKPVAKKPVKKVAKVAKAPTETAVPAIPESAIESLPTPDTQPTATVEATPATSTPVSSATPTPNTVTPVPPIVETPATPATPTDIPTVTTEPDPTAGVTTDSLTTPVGVSPLPQAAPVIDPSLATTEPSDDFEPEHKGKGMKILLIFLTALIVGGGAVAGFMYFSQGKKTTPNEKKVAAPTEAPVIPTEPVASESASTAEVAELSIQILNGSGTPGEAARVRDLLQEAGFETFSLGNADSYDYTDTEVQVKEGLAEGTFDAVKEALAPYTVVEKEALEETSDYDIIIFVGKQK